jgi:hypothetical protein
MCAMIALPFCEYIVQQYPGTGETMIRTTAHPAREQSLVSVRYRLLRQEHYEAGSRENGQNTPDVGTAGPGVVRTMNRT